MGRPRVVGVGNRFRRDDGAGPRVVDRLRAVAPGGADVVEWTGSPAGLVEAWAGRGLVIVVDAVAAGGAPGSVHRFDAVGRPLPAEAFRVSSHALGLPEAVELARATGRLPGRLVVYGIEGEDFGPGEGLTSAVELAVARTAARIARDLRAAGLFRDGLG